MGLGAEKRLDDLIEEVNMVVLEMIREKMEDERKPLSPEYIAMNYRADIMRFMMYLIKDFEENWKDRIQALLAGCRDGLGLGDRR